jgi:hypothetical protein
MPLPTSNDLHVDGVLSGVSAFYANGREFYAGDAIAPILSVDKQSDLYPTYAKADTMRIQADITADGAPAPVMSFALSTQAYRCEVYSGKTFLTRRQAAQAAKEFAIAKAHVKFVNEQILLKREKTIADNFWATSKWATDSTPTTKWDASSSTPYQDLRTGCRTIHTATGKWPTDLICGAHVWDSLADHADTIARVSGGARPGDPAVVMPEQIATILGLKRVTIAAASYNSAGAGATASMATLYSQHEALLVYRPDSPAEFEPSGAYSFSWKSFDNASAEAAAIESKEEWDPSGTWYRGQMSLDPKIVCSDCGYFFSAATS